MSCSQVDPCNQQYSSDDVRYSGPNLICTEIDTCDTLTEALQKAEAVVCSMQSTITLLQNQLNSLTTTTSTSSTTSSTTTVNPSTTTTTTVSSPVFYTVPRTHINSSSQGLIRMIFRINGGSWTTFTSNIAPSGNFYIGGGGIPPAPLLYNAIGNSIGNSMNLNPNVGDLVELYFVKDSTLQNLRFGVSFDAIFSSPTFVAAPGANFTNYCGPTNPYAFYYNKVSRFFNIDSTGTSSTWATNVLVTC